MFWTLQALAPGKTKGRRGRADRVVAVKEEEDDDNDDKEPEKEDVPSLFEREVKGKEIKKEGKKEKKDDSWEIKETKEPKEKKETIPLEAVHKQEENSEKVK